VLQRRVLFRGTDALRSASSHGLWKDALRIASSGGARGWERCAPGSASMRGIWSDVIRSTATDKKQTLWFLWRRRVRLYACDAGVPVLRAC
jgi:hypothetical protein